MKVKECLKILIFLISLWLCFSVSEKSASAEDITENVGVGAVTGSAITFYVGGNSASDANDGISSVAPFATLDKAVSSIGYNKGTIIVQSDLLLYKSVVICGDVTIISDGSIHMISRDIHYYSFCEYEGFNIWSMFTVPGKLTLGNEDNTDISQNLVFHAYNDPILSADGPLDTIYIDTSGEVDLYNGVTLDGNNRGAAVYNKGKFNMFGGMISNNAGLYAGGIYNCFNGNFIMSGGTIQDNESKSSMIGGITYGSGGVFNIGNSTFTMAGGSIINNTGYSSSGIYNGTNCTFIMTGGKLGINYTAHYANGIFNDVGANFIIGQDANILPEDEIWLVEGSTITVNSKLTIPDLWLIIISAKLDTSKNTYIENYTPGSQIIIGDPGTDRLTDIFTLSTKDYSISEQGKIVKIIKSEWVTLPEGTNYTYTGSAITPEIKVADGTKILQQGTDYIVSYENNISAGLHYISITAIGNYGTEVIASYTIKPAVATSIITSVADITTSAENCYNITQLCNILKTNSVDVLFSGGSGVLPVEWKLTGGTFDYKGGTYTLTGTLLDSINILSGGLSLTVNVNVTPVMAKIVTFNDINIPIGTNKAATAEDIGESILPTSGKYYQSGVYDQNYPDCGMITYAIDWGNKTLNTSDNKSTTTFVGTVTFVNYPKWLTIPENVTVSRKVGVTGKINVDIQCEIISKTYDSKPVITMTPSNDQGYLGRYDLLYVSTDDKGYSSKIAPKDAGNYKCIISIIDNLANYTGSKEIGFSIYKKNITIIADNKTILLNEPLPDFTYHFEKGKELISGESLLVKPVLSAINADTSKVSDYIIQNVGADAGENYTILLMNGILSVKAPDVYSITTIVGANGTISPDGKQSVLHNTDKTFAITPNTNFAVSSVFVDGVNIGIVTTYTFHNVTANHSISVTFEAKPIVPPVVPSGPIVPPSAPSSDIETTPSPTPSGTPNNKDTKDYSEKVSLIGSNGEASIIIKRDEHKRSLNIAFDLPSNEILTQRNQNSSSEQPQDITIPITSSQLLKQMKEENVQDINITIKLPRDLQNNKNIGNINSILKQEVLTVAKQKRKNVTVSITDEEGREQYSWMFNGNNLAQSNQDMEDVNLSLNVKAIKNTELSKLFGDSEGNSNVRQENKGLVINFSHHGELPSQASVRIYVGNQDGIKIGDKVLLYHYNTGTNKLESLPYSSEYTVDSDGYVTIQILHCSDYVLLTETPDKSLITALVDQISISITDNKLYFGGTTGDAADYIITMPSTLEWISSKDKTTSSAIGAVNITFTSDKPKVVAVDSRGHLIAKSVGTCTISIKVVLYNGNTKTYKTTITVKEPFISISKSKNTMKVGDTYLFEVNVYGYKKDQIKWITTKKSIIQINSRTGKATAVSSGVDYIAAQVGNKKVEVKVVVLK